MVHGAADSYISPNFYPSKAENHRVVPTWNYVTAHVYGQLVVHDDVTWLESLVRRLTDHHEAREPQPWSVDDAPAAYIAGAAAGHRRRRAGDQPDRGQGQAQPEPT